MIRRKQQGGRKQHSEQHGRGKVGSEFET